MKTTHSASAPQNEAEKYDTPQNGEDPKPFAGKNIVICCDGTGNVIGASQTNVVKLVRTIVRDQVSQCVYYDPGVGTMSAPEAMTRVTKALSKVLGLALGRGIRRNIEEAYLYLMQRYEPGDRVFLFGFSRGAYTVSSLAAMLHAVGLMEKGNENLVSLALQLYQKSSKNPDDAQLFKATFGRQCKPHFLGVWDTVASVGLLMNGDPFPSAAMNPDIQHVRHAISIDEKRAKFQVEQWEKPAHASTKSVKEVWFAGVHSDVGGGYAEKESGLAKVAMEWLLKEAKDLHLIIHDENCIKTLGLADQVEGFDELYNNQSHDMAFPDGYQDKMQKPDYKGMLHNSLTLPWKVLDLLLSISPKHRIGRRREIPKDALIHESVLKRWSQLGKQNDKLKYRPSNLQHKIDLLPNGWEDAIKDPNWDEKPVWIVKRELIKYPKGKYVDSSVANDESDQGQYYKGRAHQDNG